MNPQQQALPNAGTEQDGPVKDGPEVVTFGCRLNAYESEVIKQASGKAGLEGAIIVNTCAVTAEATRQARQSIRRLHRQRPDARVIVTGCAAQIDPESFASIDGVSAVVGNHEKLLPDTWKGVAAGLHGWPVQERPGGPQIERTGMPAGAGLLDAPRPHIAVNDIMSVRETAGHLEHGFGDRARAFVQIQNGCNHRCTFCIIPYGRGNSRSVGAGEVVSGIKKLVSEGWQEVVLTGVDITSYGEDLPGQPTLGVLVQKILTQVPDLPRLRISSIDSIEVDEPLLDAIASESRVMPHLHISLQAGDNMILKRMKRRHSREDAIRFVSAVKAKRPEMVFGADIIAGFPTETEEMFAQSLALIDECDLTWLHVFPYSEREGTPAARMPQLPKQVRRDRAARLRQRGEDRVADLVRRRAGGTASVLLERPTAGGFLGHTEDFIPVIVKGEPGADLIQCRLSAPTEGSAATPMVATPIQDAG